MVPDVNQIIFSPHFLMNYEDLSTASAELCIYAEHNEPCYRAYLLPAFKNLERKIKRGVFDLDKAILLFQKYTTVALAKQYTLEHGSMSDKWSDLFTVSDRKQLAEYWAEMVRDEVKICGNSYL
jgi:hypothetical protein